ncbi:MAG: hypothetical protein AB7R77_12665 [Ilumatobacteraceae bacterium]
MSTEPSQGDIADILARLGKLERIVEAAATAPQNVRSSIDAGRLMIRDELGNPRVILGEIGGGDYGFQLVNASGQVLLRATEDGWEIPRTPIPMEMSLNMVASGTTNPFRGGTDQTSYTELWRGDFTATGDSIVYDFYVFPNTAVMSWRIMIYEQGLGTPTAAVSETGVSANGQRAGVFTIPAACLFGGTDPVGRVMTMRVEAKRDSGAGTVDVTVNASPLCYVA